MPDDAKSADGVTPEGKARDTIDNLLTGKIIPKTIRDLGDAVDRAKQNASVGRAFRG